MDYDKIIITGGCGFLGQFITKQLLQTPNCPRLKIIDLKPNSAALYDFTNEQNLNTVLDKDISDYDSIAPEFKDADCVIHLAGIVSFSLKDKGLLTNVNVNGTRNVLKAAAENNIKTVIHVSSVAALGYNDDKHNPIAEDFRFDWTIAEKRKKYYMLTKHLADVEVNRFRQQGLNIAVVYPGLMFGPGDVTNSARLIKAIADRKIPFNMPGGTNIVDVRDVAAGIVNIAKNPSNKDDYLLSGDNLTFEEINKTIARALSTKPPTLTLPRFLNPILFPLLLLIESISKNKLELTADNLDSAFKFRYFDNAKAIDRLHWQRQFDFNRTIKDTIEWMNSNGKFE